MNGRMRIGCILVLFGSACGFGRADGGGDAYRWTATWDAKQGADNLELVTTVMDGYVDRIDVDGRAAIRTQGAFLYFAVSNDYLYEAGLDLTLTVEIFDAMPGVMLLTYDGMVANSRVSYLDSTDRFEATGSGAWKRVVFEMPSAFLADGTNDDSDFRFAFLEGTKLPIRRLELSVQGLEGRTYATAEAMHRARRDLKARRTGARMRRVLDAWAPEAAELQAVMAAADEPVREALRPFVEGYRRAVDRLGQTAEAGAFEEDGPLDAFIQEQERWIQSAANALKVARGRARLADFIGDFGQGRTDWVFFTRSATDNFQVIVPWTVPVAVETNAPVRMQLCRGEYEPGHIGLLSRRPARRVTLTASDLVAPGGLRIPAGHVDVRIAQYWYQAGRRAETLGPRQLIPELLLYDDAIVRADLLRRENVLNFQGAIEDAERLLPFDLEACYTKLLWLTVRAPDDAAAGIYRGLITVAAEDLPSLTIPLQVQVLPFDLAANPKIASMYYHGRAPEGPSAAVEKYRRRLINMRDHGLTDPMFRLGSDEDNERELALRQEIGLNRGPLLADGRYSVWGFVSDDAPLDQRTAKLRETSDYLWDLAGRYGFDGACMSARDEAAGDHLRAEIPAFRLLEKWGRTGAMAAVLSDFATVAVRDMQMPNYCGFPSKQTVDAVHDAGHKILRYADPQGGAEDPRHWRYAYGLALWELDLDGGCTWAYRAAIGNPWNDFDGDGTYRDFMMTYPGVDGPIDTVQWEGYREANDDLRYMQTLELALARARNEGRHPRVVAEVDAWFLNKHERRFRGENLDAVRERIVQYVLRLTDSPR